MPKLSPFREVGSKKTFRPPYTISGVRLYGFLLPADAATLDQTIGDALDAPDGSVTYRSALPIVLLSFTELGRLAASDPPDAGVGWVSEKEMTTWVLAARESKGLADALAWYIPYIVVDSPDALLTGREVEGFPKEMGNIVVDPKGFAAEAWVFPKFSPATEVTCMPVAKATPTAQPPTAGVVWRTLEDALGGLAKEIFKEGPLLPSLKLAVDMVASLLKKELGLVFLKQERDVGDGGMACYQAVTEAPVKVTGFRGGGLLDGQYAIEVASFDSHPMVADLGLDPAVLGSVKGFWLDFDFVLEKGKVIWQAT